MASQVLRQFPVVAEATPVPSHPVLSTTTDVHSPPIPKASGTKESSGNFGEHDKSDSRLLFIAPFFGVVLLSFGIVIGVKRCLRYNARNRVGVTDDNHGRVTRETVQRLHRRRREERFMTVDEVNEQFPMMKYRSWAAERTREGLPTPGGVSVPASRGSGTRDTNCIVLDISSKGRQSPEQRRPSDVADNSTTATLSERVGNKDVEKTEPGTKQPANPGQTSGTKETSLQEQPRGPNGNDSDEDGPMDAMPNPECPSTPGDTCAICISTLEDDNDVRALICGHVFHAVCVDLWLTSRRACCPLCNRNCAPKPKPERQGSSDAANNLSLRENNVLNVPGAPRAAWFRGSTSNLLRQRSSLIRDGRESRSRHTNRDQPQDPSQRYDTMAPAPPGPMDSVQSSDDGMFSPVQPPQWLGRPENDQPTMNETVTPSRLEAGSCEAATSTQ